MTRHALVSRLFSSAFVLALAACGGPDASETASTTSNVVGNNCRELCRRYVSCSRFRPGSSTHIGRTFSPVANSCQTVAEDYLVQAGQGRAENRCWRGNQAVAGSWGEIQPRSDIYRDDPGNANALVNRCASDFGIY